MLNAVELAQYVESAKQFYGALEELETALGATRFLAGDFVTEADAALYVTLVRFDLLYSRYLGPVKYRVQDLEKCFGLLKRSVPDSGICTSHRFCSHHPPGKN